jgi:hypothetical protein
MNPADPQPQPTNKMSQLRRSQRVCLRLPIVVLREGPGTNVASEETQTLIVNAHGALIPLALTVEIGQLLVIKNGHTLEQLVCRVVHLGPEQTGKREVGIEFENPAPRFWRIAFPPSDWTPRSADAKAPTKHLPGGRAPRPKTGAAPAEVAKKQVPKLPAPVQHGPIRFHFLAGWSSKKTPYLHRPLRSTSLIGKSQCASRISNRLCSSFLYVS